jgi:hypothetical protein
VQEFGRKWEHQWLSLQWHKGVAGMGKGWDDKMTAQIRDLENNGFEMCSAIQQPDATWYILFFKRQKQ